MLNRLLEAISVLVTQRRAGVLVGVLIIAAALASQLTKLESDPSPHKVVSSFENQDAILADLTTTFGDAENVLLVLVQSEDVLAKPSAQYVHTLSRKLRASSGVTKVASITVTPLPHRAGEVRDEDVIDEDLEKELLGLDEGDDDGDTAEDGSPNDGTEAPAPAPPAPEAPSSAYGLDAATVMPIIEGDDQHFPRGIFSLSERAEREGLQASVIVEGDEVTDREVEALRRVAENSPLVRGQLVSADGKLAVIALYLSDELTSQKKIAKSMDEIRAVIEGVKPPAGASARLGGLPHMRDSLVKKIRADQMTLNPIIAAVCALVLALAFRWLPGVWSPLAAVSLTALMVAGGMGLFGLRLNVVTNIVPPLLIIIGISDSIHLLARYRDELRTTEDKIEAGRKTVKTMAVACFLTSATTAAGFGSLAIARTEMFRQFGIIAAVGVLLAYVVTIAFIPAVLTYVKPPVASKKSDRELERGSIEVGVFIITLWILRHPWQVVGGAVVLAGLAAATATRIDADVRLMDQFDQDDEVYVVTELLEDKLQGVRPLEVSLKSETAGRFYDPKVIESIDGVARWAEARPETLGSTSFSDVLHEVSALATGDPAMRQQPFRNAEQVQALAAVARKGDNSTLHSYVTDDGRRARLTIHFKDVGSNQSVVLIDELRRRLDSALAEHGVTYELTGEAYTGSVGRAAVLRDLVGGLAMAFAIIFGMLAVLLRSVRLVLLSILPNVIPLVFTAAYMALRGIPLNTATAVTFSIGIGLAVDGTIHVLARFKEEHARGMGVNVALLRAARGTGRAIIVTCATLVLGFSIVMLSRFISVRQFGELIAVTVVGILFGTIVVQPAVLKIGGKRALEST